MKAKKRNKPKTGDMTDRIVAALRKTFRHITDGLSEEEFREIGEQGCYKLAADCYLEMYGDDAEAARIWFTLGSEVQDGIMKQAFPLYRPTPVLPD